MADNQEELRQKRLARIQAMETNSVETPASGMEISDAPQKIARTVPSNLPQSPAVVQSEKPAKSIPDVMEIPSNIIAEEVDNLEKLCLSIGSVFNVDASSLKAAFPAGDVNSETFLKSISQYAFFTGMSSKEGIFIPDEVLELCAPKNRNDVILLAYISGCYSRCFETKFSNDSNRGVVMSCILNFALLMVNGGLTSAAFDCNSFFYLFKENMLGSNFLVKLLALVKSEATLTDNICHPILKNIGIMISEASIVNQSFRQPVELLNELCSLKLQNSNIRPFCSSMIRLDNWLPDPFTKDIGDELKAAPGMEMQVLSYLGPFFRLSSFAEDDVLVLYDCYAVDEPSVPQMNMTNAGLASNSEILRRHLHEIVHFLLVNLESRVPMLNYIYAVLERSWKRRQHYFDYRIVGSDGFILNWLYVLQKLCVKINLEKVSKTYLWHPNCRIAPLLQSDDARVRYNKQEVEHFLANRKKNYEDEVDPSFSTECYFMTTFIHHIGIVSIVRRFNNRNRGLHELREMKKKLEKKEEEGRQLTKEEVRQLKLVKIELSAVRRMGLSIMGSLTDPCLIDQTIQFLNKFCLFLLSYIFSDPKQAPIKFASTSIDDLPAEFRALPEFFFENIVEWLFFYARAHPVELAQSYVDDIITWFTLFLSNTTIIKNPFLTARMVETLFMLCPMSPRHPTERLFTTIVMAPIALAGLVPSLMKFYVDCELTGSHTEFFDKFNIRYHISVIFRQIWNLVEYKTAIVKEAQTACTIGAQSVFVKFVNMLINDCTFFLDESMQLLKKIHEIEELQSNESEWNALGEEQKKEKMELLAQNERIVPQYLNLGDDNLQMFAFLTKDAKKAFLVPEIVEKLAAMLNYNLAQLCGPRCRELKVRDPKKFNWEPKRLLQRIINIYLILDCEKFANAVASDERSFSSDLFPRAFGIVQKTGIIPGTEAEQFQAFGEQVMSIGKERAQEELDLGEPPEHFKDALMDSLMSDPVQLPSGNICDRTIVTRLLLDRPADPFNRQEMTEDDLIPLPELKAEIKNWLKQRREELRQSRK